MAFNLNTLLTGGNTGGTWSQGSNPTTLTLNSTTGIISNITITNGQVTNPVCLPAGTYVFTYSIEQCPGGNLDTEDVSIVVEDTVEVDAVLPTIYVCRKDLNVDLVQPNNNTPSPGILNVNLESENYVKNCLNNNVYNIPVEYRLISQTGNLITTDITDTNNNGIDISINDLFPPINNAVSLNRQVRYNYRVFADSECSDIVNNSGQILIGPNLETFNTTYSDCVDENISYPIGTFLPNEFYTWANNIDATPNSSGELSVNNISFGSFPGGLPSTGEIRFEAFINNFWTQFDPFDVNDSVTITATNTGINQTIQYRAIYEGLGMICLAESTIVISSDVCCPTCLPLNYHPGADDIPLTIIVPPGTYNLSDAIAGFVENTILNGCEQTIPPNIVTNTYVIWYDCDLDPNNYTVTSTGNITLQGYNMFQSGVIGIMFNFEPNYEGNSSITITYDQGGPCENVNTWNFIHNCVDPCSTILLADGTFEDCINVASSTNFFGDLSCSNFMPIEGTPDIIIFPHSFLPGAITSPNGGAAIHFTTLLPISQNPDIYKESFTGNIQVIGQGQYELKFYQCFLKSHLNNPGDTAFIDIEVDGTTLQSPIMSYQGAGSQTWQLVTLNFTANTNGISTLKFTTSSNTLVQGNAYNLGIDGIEINCL